MIVELTEEQMAEGQGCPHTERKDGMNQRCVRCGSFAINHHLHGRDGSREALCDVCFWREKAEYIGKLSAQRGARMQIMSKWMKRDTSWSEFVSDYPEAREWFDADGVPVR